MRECRSPRLLGWPVFPARAFTACSASHLFNKAEELAASGDRDFLALRRALRRLALVGHESEGSEWISGRG
jgi:hypothetical protein